MMQWVREAAAGVATTPWPEYLAASFHSTNTVIEEFQSAQRWQ